MGPRKYFHWMILRLELGKLGKTGSKQLGRETEYCAGVHFAQVLDDTCEQHVTGRGDDDCVLPSARGTSNAFGCLRGDEQRRLTRDATLTTFIVSPHVQIAVLSNCATVERATINGDEWNAAGNARGFQNAVGIAEAETSLVTNTPAVKNALLTQRHAVPLPCRDGDDAYQVELRGNSNDASLLRCAAGC